MAMFQVIKSSASEDSSLLVCYVCPKYGYLTATLRAGNLEYSCPEMLLPHDGTVKARPFGLEEWC